jgi:hypothetical protein
MRDVPVPLSCSAPTLGKGLSVDDAMAVAVAGDVSGSMLIAQRRPQIGGAQVSECSDADGEGWCRSGWVLLASSRGAASWGSGN